MDSKQIMSRSVNLPILPVEIMDMIVLWAGDDSVAHSLRDRISQYVLDRIKKNIKNILKHCLNENAPVILSCDNKSDQLNQYNRISKELNNENVTLVKMSNSKYWDIIEDCLINNKKIIMFCLDNASQIKKVRRAIMSTLVFDKKIKLKKIAIIHDKGHVITKDCDIKKLYGKKSLKAKELLILTQYFSREEIELKRIIVKNEAREYL
jgi:hypothetical protein